MEPRTMRPRIADVAREAGVSKTAVSFAFNSPDRLSSDTAERIRRVAEELGYSPNPVARMLSQGETLTIGVLTPQALSVIFSNPFFAAFSEGVAVAAEESGYALYFISPLHGSLARAMSRATVDGVVAIGLSDDHPEVEQIRRAGVPIVMVDSTALPGLGSIEVDDVGGARAAAEHLIGLGPSGRPGHRRRAAGARDRDGAGWRRGAAAARLSPGVRGDRRRDRRRSGARRPGQHRRGQGGPRQGLGGGQPADRDPGHERRDGDRCDPRACATWACRCPAT